MENATRLDACYHCYAAPVFPYILVAAVLALVIGCHQAATADPAQDSADRGEQKKAADVKNSVADADKGKDGADQDDPAAQQDTAPSDEADDERRGDDEGHEQRRPEPSHEQEQDGQRQGATELAGLLQAVERGKDDVGLVDPDEEVHALEQGIALEPIHLGFHGLARGDGVGGGFLADDDEEQRH